MQKIALLILCLLSLGIKAQTPFFQENFNNNCATGCLGSAYNSSNGNWTVSATGTNGINANLWFVSCSEDGFLLNPTCANACSGGLGDATAHIGNVAGSTAAPLICPGGDCRAIYDDTTPAEQSDTRLESPVIDCTIYDNISLQMMYLAGGVSCADDYFSIEYFDGTVWSTLVACVPQTNNNCPAPYIGNWAVGYTVALPASADNNPNVRIGFRWVNNGNGVGTDPSVAINDVVLRGDTTIVLAMAFTQFQAIPGNQDIQLRWSTSEDMDTHTFQIERSADGKKYDVIGEVPAISRHPSQTYEWTDLRPFDGISYYRIRHTDVMGKTGYTETKSVNFGLNKTFSLHFPTVYSSGQMPSAEVYSSIPRTVSIEVLDMAGRHVMKKENIQLNKGYNTLSLDIEGRITGWYLLQILPSAEDGEIMPLRSRFILQ